MKYRFALVGCGQIGPRHAIQMARLGEITAVCDSDRTRADRLGLQYHCPAFYSLEDLLHSKAEIDVVSVCTPNYLHADHSIQCLRAGHHVICEKPMTISSRDVNRILDAVKSTGTKFFVVKQNRFNPPVAFVKRLIDENGLGQIHSFQVNCFWNRTAQYYQNSWKGRKEFDGGILYTQFSHFIDLLIWYLGEARTVQAIGGNFLLSQAIEFEDTGCAILTLENGSIGTLHFTVTSYAKNMEGSITLFGEKGTVKIGGQYLNTLEYFQVQGRAGPVIAQGRTENDYGSYQGSMSNHDKVYEEVVKALDNKEHNLVEGLEAGKTVHMIETLYEAMETPQFGEL